MPIPIPYLWLSLLTLVGSTVVAAPPPGHPTLDQAQQLLGLATPQQLPYRGQVMEAIPSNSYIYLRVHPQQGGELWLAAPLANIPLQSWISFGEGRRMTNFYSKKHQRTFIEVVFVDRVEMVVSD